ncbi:hypothetical protein DV707_15545 (plasmid) [Halobellus limi]|uniref:Uncharacterized protein n=1 Tax=Halobellus limi TaxID=699433 RepID=A0A4D6H844_9EURY|nr:hypothetical protein DV707_15545 [Halobellus limi]
MKLSDERRQRIAIARPVLQDSEILLLDGVVECGSYEEPLAADGFYASLWVARPPKSSRSRTNPDFDGSGNRNGYLFLG